MNNVWSGFLVSDTDCRGKDPLGTFLLSIPHAVAKLIS